MNKLIRSQTWKSVNYQRYKNKNKSSCIPEKTDNSLLAVSLKNTQRNPARASDFGSRLQGFESLMPGIVQQEHLIPGQSGIRELAGPADSVSPACCMHCLHSGRAFALSQSCSLVDTVRSVLSRLLSDPQPVKLTIKDNCHAQSVQTLYFKS